MAHALLQEQSEEVGSRDCIGGNRKAERISSSCVYKWDPEMPQDSLRGIFAVKKEVGVECHL